MRPGSPGTEAKERTGSKTATAMAAAREGMETWGAGERTVVAGFGLSSGRRGDEGRSRRGMGVGAPEERQSGDGGGLRRAMRSSEASRKRVSSSAIGFCTSRKERYSSISEGQGFAKPCVLTKEASTRSSSH